MWASLLQMRKLEVLIIERGKHDDALTVIPLIKANSGSLRHLEFESFDKLRDSSSSSN